MMRNACKANICFLFFALSTLLFALPLEAKVAGNCSNCHTMHNSQGGQPVARGDDAWGGTGGLTDAIPSLLVASCLGCHSSVDGLTIKIFGSNRIPIVFNTSGYPSNPLAGGNFYSVTTDDTKGHNISAGNADDYLHWAPGDAGTRTGCDTSACHYNLYETVKNMSELRLNGRKGCEKCHLDPKHHADDHGPTGGLVTSAEQGWYRFLSGHNTGVDKGVAGYEDRDWQQNTGHNEYSGTTRNPGSGTYGFYGLGNTMTAYCTGCHGDFHGDQGTASPWLRHPSDAKLPNSGEYASYTTYNPLVPVARPDLDVLSPLPYPYVRPGTDMVMCLSCHRAHASPYYKMMRWDYKGEYTSSLSEALSGCSVCHTSKN